MTVNEQHLIFAQQALLRVKSVQQNLESMCQVLEQHPAPKRDPLARQTTMLINNLVQALASSEVTSEMLERSLRYSRMGGVVEAEGDTDE